jgi:hypothetical protein
MNTQQIPESVRQAVDGRDSAPVWGDEKLDFEQF